MRVLITGATGFVGRAISARLGLDHEIVGLARHAADGLPFAQLRVDLGQPGASDGIAAELGSCDAIVHAAASKSTDPYSPETATANCLGTMEALRVAELTGATRFVFTSGLPVIGTPVDLPITEEHPADPRTPYHASKLFCEQLVSLAGERGLGAATLRLTAPVGPGLPDGRILSVFARSALAGEPLNLAGKGTRRQDYIDVRDLAEAVALCLERDAAGLFNVARGESVSNKELATRVLEVLDSDSEIRLGARPDPEDEVTWDVSIQRARESLGWEPQFGIDDAIVAAGESVH